MSRFHLVIMLVAIAVIGAGCGKKSTTSNANSVTNTTTVTNTSTNTGSTNTNPAETATLTYTASGISPKILTIGRGTTVTIINNDSRSHEIASNPHPDHTDLPGLDKPVSPGSSTTFTFTQTGSWGYHDHDDPFDDKWKGTVIVQ